MTNRFEKLAAAGRKPVRHLIGLISGTSADSIDFALCRVGGGNGRVALLHYEEVPYPGETRRAILNASGLGVQAIAELHLQVGEAFADACLGALRRSGFPGEEVDAVGSHGQTIYHHSSFPGTLRATLQVGDADVIAERTGLPVFADFRARDVACGGEGAPLTPRADMALFPGEGRRVVLNLGGIANITVLDPDPSRVFGFDTGPANSLLDRLARRLSDGKLDFDRDGELARSGRASEEAVVKLIQADEYLARRPPKSTGPELYGDALISRAAGLVGGVTVDLMATLTEFTARTVALGIKRFACLAEPPREVIAAGGGVKNPALLERIRELVAPIPLFLSDQRGVPADAREGMAFAVLADLALRGEASSLPSVTGASRSTVLGKLSFAG